ncbi:MAG TPA: threonine/serine exporter family protein, partial [Vulgatibacter sp.]
MQPSTLGNDMEPEKLASDPKVDLLLRLARALHRYGVPAHRLEGLMSRLSETLGLQGSVYSSPTAIFASFGDPSELRTAMIRVDPGDTDLGRLADLDVLATEVMQGKVDARKGLARLDSILASPPLYGPGLTFLCFILVATGATVLLGGQLRELIGSVAISAWLGFLLVLAKKRPGLDRVNEALGAFGAA